MQHYKYYGMNLEPFSNTPDSRFYYNSDQHSNALAKLSYATKSMKGLAVLMGDVGTGKTTIARKLLNMLSEDEYEASMLVIIHTKITADWLLAKIAVQLGIDNPAEEKVKLLSQVFERLVEITEEGRSAVILVDEAQMLKDREIMEEFRGLLNLEIPGKKFVTFVFFGLPDLENNLKQDEPLNQRVAMRYRLGHFNLGSTENYIKHRLKVAGATRMLFTSEAIESIQVYSTGIPRLINNICDNALLEGMLSKSDLIGRAIIEKVAGELGLSRASKDLLQEIESQKYTRDVEPMKTDDAQQSMSGRISSPATPMEGLSSSREQGSDGEDKIEIDKILDSLDIE
ncbi:MAG: AAA family ATPase [Deltaproteobacteria bacterium]|nr:AAA family ATPase [Candidatus Zymogenaceae bacterium]